MTKPIEGIGGIKVRYRMDDIDMKIIGGILGGKQYKQIAAEVGLTPSSVSTRINGRVVSEAMRMNGEKPDTRIKQALRELMERSGLTDEELLMPIRDGVKAMKVIENKRTGEEREVPDHWSRLQASRLGFELKGAFPEKGSAGVVALQVITNIGREADAETVQEVPGGFMGEMMLREGDDE